MPTTSQRVREALLLANLPNVDGLLFPEGCYELWFADRMVAPCGHQEQRKPASPRRSPGAAGAACKLAKPTLLASAAEVSAC